jgi:hypothetical protein
MSFWWLFCAAKWSANYSWYWNPCKVLSKSCEQFDLLRPDKFFSIFSLAAIFCTSFWLWRQDKHCLFKALVAILWSNAKLCDGWEKDSNRNIIFRCSSIGSFFSGVSYCDKKECVFCLTMIQKRKTSNIDNLINTRGLCSRVQIR